LKPVEHVRIRPGMTVGDLVDEMGRCGVLGAGRVGEAAEVVAEMFSDPDYTVFLALAGALVPSGLRSVIRGLIEDGHVDVLVTTGANLVHDMVEALGHRHLRGTFRADDQRLREEDVGRIGDVFVEQEAFRDLEKWMHRVLAEIPEDRRRRTSVADLLAEFGRRIHDPDSILAAAAARGVPVICPALTDSIAGFHLWTFAQDGKLGIDPLLDTAKIVDAVFEAKKAGVIILGGGVPKHFTLFANTLREGVDSAVQVTMDRPEPGGLSGAPLEEAVSWGKVKPGGRMVTVICDATIAFPLIVAAALENLQKTH